jgi:hypothetical protein
MFQRCAFLSYITDLKSVRNPDGMHENSNLCHSDIGKDKWEFVRIVIISPFLNNAIVPNDRSRQRYT